MYSFAAYVQKRDAIRQERAAAEAVVEAITHLEEPGAVIELKQKVDGWFSLHREVLKVVNSA